MSLCSNSNFRKKLIMKMSFSKSILMPQGLASRRFVVNELAFSLSFHCCTTPSPPHNPPHPPYNLSKYPVPFHCQHWQLHLTPGDWIVFRFVLKCKHRQKGFDLSKVNGLFTFRLISALGNLLKPFSNTSKALSSSCFHKVSCATI